MAASAYEILDNNQVLFLLRYFAYQDFLHDLESPFVRPEMDTYLQLSAEDLGGIRSLAREENAKLRIRIRDLDEEVFDELAAKLHPEASQRIGGLFEDVWNCNL